ncbi:MULTISPECIES: GerAB/ArcD/ProY family transporter [Paenibacillus]|uniref:GerAB/ArcD/ProY family transporter n=1 Tax=Paenibacillus TaxID=44249 RepID=UPI0022B88DEF|nr:endospore germination permease [Paenibacillus caseinilyticus]MCZ8523519.1 endospore germination permease [Paenibacillus caseinilyticus]
MNEERISISQLSALMCMFTISSSTLLIPTFLTTQAKQDAWIAVTAGTLVSFLFIPLYTKLGNSHPRQTLVEYSEAILGRMPGKAVSLLFLGYVLILTSGLLRQLGEMITTLTLSQTPIQAVHAVMLLLVVFSVRRGLESIARASEIFLPWVLTFILFFLLFLAPKIHYHYLLPVYEHGLPPIVKGAITVIGIPYLDLVVFLMILPHLRRTENAGKAFRFSLVTGGTIVLLFTLFSILVLGAQATERSVYPLFQMAQKVDIGNFIQRIEVLVGGVWFISLFFKLTVCFYAAVLGLCQVFGLKSYREITFPIGLLVGVLAMIMAPSSVYFLNTIREIWAVGVLPYGLLLPLLLLLVHTLKRRSTRSPRP